MRNRAQELHAVALLLHGIVRRGVPLHHNSVRLDLKGLLRLRRRDERPGHDHGRAHIEVRDLAEVLHGVVEHNLQCLEKCPVVQDQESKGL